MYHPTLLHNEATGWFRDWYLNENKTNGMTMVTNVKTHTDSMRMRNSEATLTLCIAKRLYYNECYRAV